LPPLFFQLDTERAEWMGNQETVAGIGIEDKKVGGRACKPDSVPHASQKLACARGDHSSSPGIATGIQQPTRGFYRAGPALPSYLALHHAGFSVPLVSPPGRWALTPPFHPCQTSRAFRRRLTGFPVRCHRASLRRRSILCGTFRSAVVAPGFSPASSTSPPGVTRRVALSRVPLTIPQPPFGVRELISVPQDGVRTFLPLQPCSGGFTPPFLGLSQRSPGPPASLIIPR